MRRDTPEPCCLRVIADACLMSPASARISTVMERFLSIILCQVVVEVHPRHLEMTHAAGSISSSLRFDTVLTFALHARQR